MDAAPKRVCRGGRGSASDRLSSLSDDLLRHILSFLPSRCAVQTCLLSKRWIDLWRSVPAVRLSISDFGGGFGANDIGWRKMKDFTTEFLMHQSVECLDVFRLVIDRRCYPREDVERWARCGINRRPLDLQICAAVDMHWKDFGISRFSSAFRRLKRLVLCRLSLDHSFADMFNPGCPVLEDLVLYYCRHEFDVIQSDTLKNLSVDTCGGQVGGVLVVRAPCIASLCLDNYKYGLSLETGNSLVRASIYVVLGDTSQRDQTILLGSLFNVTSLELTYFHAMAILDKEFDKFPTFDNLRTLSLRWCFLSGPDVDKFKAIGRFLQKSPNLEKLTLQGFLYSEGTVRKRHTSKDPGLKKVKPVVGPSEFPVLGNLRTLFLDQCDLRDNFQILHHFLWSCPNLEKLTIELCKLPKISTGGKRGSKLKTAGKGGAKTKKTHSGFRNLVRIQCCKLKSTEIIYKKGAKIQDLVSLLVDVSECAPVNTITLTK